MDNFKTCAVCGKKAAFHSAYLKQEFCKKHFERMLMRRIRSNMVSNGMRGHVFHLLNENPCGFDLLDFLFVEKSGSKKIDLSSHTLEDFAIAVMKYFLFHEESKIRIRGKDRFSPLFNVSEDEIFSFFSLKNKSVAKNRRRCKDQSVIDFLSEIEKRRPGGMISLVKAGIELEII